MFITILLIVIFLSNFCLYWLLFLKTERKVSKAWDNYTKIYVFFWVSPLVIIPVLTSSFLEPIFGTISYFQAYWPGFLLIGIILIIFGIKLLSLATKQNKNRGLMKGKHRLITKGAYEISRHPMYTAWCLIFIGLALIFDSLISLLIIPFFALLLEFEAILEEKYLLMPLFQNAYPKYKEKVQSRLIPPPYNTLLVIIAIFVVYIGALNFIIEPA